MMAQDLPQMMFNLTHEITTLTQTMTQFAAKPQPIVKNNQKVAPKVMARIIKLKNNNISHNNYEYYDGVFTIPLLIYIHNYPLPLDLKAPKFKIFSGEQDPKKHPIGF